MEPDIIIPLTPDPEGPTAHVWVEAVELTRQGQTVTPGLTDKWRISLPLRASLGMGNTLMLDSNGNEIPTVVPLETKSLDVATLIHHPEVAALLTQLRDTTIRIARGDLQPLILESTP